VNLNKPEDQKVHPNIKVEYVISLNLLTKRCLDFEKVAANPSIIKEEDKVDIVLGSDIIYGLHLAGSQVYVHSKYEEWVPKVLDALLKPDGVFYGVNPKNRLVNCNLSHNIAQGVDEFIANVEQLGFQVTMRTHDEQYWEDFVKKSCWDFFIITRKT